ncbi:MAG: winged helix DNA-binding domain-containing protein [Chloroflexota bacterium]|nr:winged helix DNA-binding domain-containing protein [Chloroflexota bacterium]
MRSREILDGKILSREELAAAVTALPGLEHIGEALLSGWGTLLKPLAWQGDLCFGPSRGNRVTFTRPQAASARWGGVPPADEAAPIVIVAYLGAHGPATTDNFRNWLSRGRIGARTIRSWIHELGDRLVEVDVDGVRANVLAEHVAELTSAHPSSTVRLLPGFDQYVLGPGTEDHHVVPAPRRRAVSRQSGWIAPVVVAGGRVSGTWELEGDPARVAWFTEAGRPPPKALEAEVARLSSMLGRELSPALSFV